jgi:hypothetical protein
VAFPVFEAAWTGADLRISSEEANAAAVSVVSGGVRVELHPGETLRIWPTLTDG